MPPQSIGVLISFGGWDSAIPTSERYQMTLARGCCLDHSSWRVLCRSFSYHPSHVLELLLWAGLSTQCLLI